MKANAPYANATGSPYNVDDYVDFLPFPPRSQDERQRLHSSHKRTLIPYDRDMHGHTAIYFPGDYRHQTRILTHFYTYLFWHSHHLEHVYKRLVRDRLHYHDDIFCAAGKIIRLIHEEAASLSQNAPLQKHHSTYIAYHIRRGDFQYKDTRITAEEVYSNTKHLLHPQRTSII
eukprot:GSChrysophyteH2.ASY1.ANO1.1631.1 assembled CDS